MGLHPSGSAREDVELVVIETKACSLVIKGKPYHQKYEGLQQYKNMDFHNNMQFNVNGKDIEEVAVYDVDENVLNTKQELRPIFFENSVYQVIVSPKENHELSFYHEHPALRKAIDRVNIGSSYLLMGNLHFQNDIGLSTFEIHSNHKMILQVTIEVFPSKIDYKRDYQNLLLEVNDEIYNLAYHFLKKTYLGAKIKVEGAPSLTEFFRLIRFHFEAFIDALNRIERQPHHQLIKMHEKRRGDQLQRLDSKARNYLRKRGQLFVEVDKGIEMFKQQLMPVEGLKMRKALTYDTFENRYVKWMMERLLHKLEALYKKLTTKRHDVEVDPDLIDKIELMKKRLTAKKKNHFWKEIGQLDRSVMSLVLQMAPGYRDAFQIYLTVSKGLALQGKLYQMSVKDVATLYEYWTYLKLGQILAKKYVQVSQDVIKVNSDGLYVNLDANATAKRVFKHPITDEKIILTYQKNERNLPTVQQKPDTMLSIQKKGRDYTFNYVFDAKYRIDFAVTNSYYGNRYQTPGPLEEDINTMHRYRDSIVVQNQGPYERNAFGAYVLFPWGDEESYQEHHFYKSIDQVNIGGLPFLPQATDLVEQFVEHLIEKSPEEIQQEGILPRGSKEDWLSSLEEKVLIGVVSSIDQYKKCIQEGNFSLSTNHIKQGWQSASYVALYVSKEVGIQNGVICYGKISDVVVNEDQIHFSVKSWTNLKQVIKPVNYGIAVYTLTTLSVLKEANELPELFMKSKQEMSLWRMLRRVSDRIKVELDENQLDNATKVKTYKIKDVEIKLYPNENKIVFVKEGYLKEVALGDLLKQPSSVFKVLLDVMQ
ncbi:restriction endonuclease [Anaerobacillus alkalidiazotrophicus]|uniref:Restriction endonuclease n=1 Tax=Anaerobacillus alkalidiazotrophicus TaxID=472963 RepID=A0A1S2LVH9_9BACI|nr:restriction endonuclease-like protein [Anaerobacillus alkalidiazotrophicus]OIJ16542.1 restriction endonuclease [Anaerobacillus alkalidiazotrophicus]